jgi:hypothetical protein
LVGAFRECIGTGFAAHLSAPARALDTFTRTSERSGRDTATRCRGKWSCHSGPPKVSILVAEQRVVTKNP